MHRKQWFGLLGSVILSTVLSVSAVTAHASRASLVEGPQSARVSTSAGQPATSVNLALNQPAWADSACSAAEGAARAVDGTIADNSKWCSNGATKWWQVDLGAAGSVSRFVIKHAGAGGESTEWNTRDFTLSVSTDGTNWARVVTVAGNTADETTHTVAATPARYVHLDITAPTNTTDPAARIYEVEVYGSSGAPPPTSTPTPTPVPDSEARPTLLDSYNIAQPQPDYHRVKYRPHQFVGGYTFDPSDGPVTVDNPGAYTGWDLLNTPSRDINTVMNNPAWLTLRLTRPARAAVVWRADPNLPAWLAAWTPAGSVTLGGRAYPTYTTSLAAGEHRLGSVFDTPGFGPYSRATYLVLLAEATGQPSPTPPVPAGREVPQPNQTCPAWVHDQYTTTGPDGRPYPTWHAQIDPVYWCYFGHEHGSNPAHFHPTYRPVYGYASTAAGVAEPHPGFKSYVFNDGRGQTWLITHHFGTDLLNRACTRFHEVDVAVKDNATGEVLADLHLTADFGMSVVNTTEQPLMPPNCPGQAAQAAGSNGVRKLPSADAGAVGYEPWRMDTSGNILGFASGGLGFNTIDTITICNSVVCNQPVFTGGSGTFRFFTYDTGFGIQAGANTGTFYTDARGNRLLNAEQPGAVRQYVKPGLSIALTRTSADEECYDVDGWGRPYRCGPDPLTGNPTNREDSIRSPN